MPSGNLRKRAGGRAAQHPHETGRIVIHDNLCPEFSAWNIAYQPAAEAAHGRGRDQRSAPLLPLHDKSGIAAGFMRGPAHRDPAIRIAERSLFDRIGGQFMQRHTDHLGSGRSDHHLWPGAINLHQRIAQKAQMHLDQFIERDIGNEA